MCDHDFDWLCTSRSAPSTKQTAALTVHTIVVLACRCSPLYWREMCHHPCGNGTAVWHPGILSSYHRLGKGNIPFQISLEMSECTNKATITFLSFVQKAFEYPLAETCVVASFLPWWTMSWSMRCCMRQAAVARSGASLWLTSQSMSSWATKQFGYVRRWWCRSLISFSSWSLNLKIKFSNNPDFET